MFNLKVFLEFVLISADDSGATEAVAECRILLAQSPDLHPLCPADPSTLHHVPLPPTHMTSSSSSLPTLATSQHTRATSNLDYKTVSSKPQQLNDLTCPATLLTTPPRPTLTFTQTTTA